MAIQEDKTNLKCNYKIWRGKKKKKNVEEDQYRRKEFRDLVICQKQTNKTNKTEERKCLAKTRH